MADAVKEETNAKTAKPAKTAEARALRLAAGLIAAALVLALANAMGIVITVPRSPAGGLSLRTLYHLFDVAETLGLGVVAAAVVAAFVRLVHPPRVVGFAVAFAATTAVVYAAIGENLTRLASLTWDGRRDRVIFVTYLVVVSLAIPGAYLLASLAAERRYLRLLPVVVASLIMVAGYYRQADDYQGIHGVFATGAAMLAGAALGAVAERWGRRLFADRRGRRLLGALGVFALAGVVVPPPNAVRYELFRIPAAVAPWALASTLWRAPSLHAQLATPAPDMEPPTSTPLTMPRLLPLNPVVVLLTIDAVRADAISDPTNDAILPTFAKLKRDGVVFTHASSPSAQTALSITTMFSGRTFSELYWVDHGEGMRRFLYPAEDPSPRFTEVLSSHSVPTATVASLAFLSSDFGVVRGFKEDLVVAAGSLHARAKEVIDPLLTRMTGIGPGPAFLYVHLMEPHAPYDRGRKDGTDRERYLSEIAVADAQIARVLSVLETRFGKRWMLIVSADHGESFGEHGTHGHAKTLYEELLHVPLIVRAPVLTHAVIDERVGLIDIGPTLLDLYRLDTPPTFLGQTLVPILEHQPPAFTRALFAEGRLRRALTLPSGIKVIEDLRRKYVEVYDLSVDPGETVNLYDRDPARADLALGTLRTFFAKHTRTEGGYQQPYKP